MAETDTGFLFSAKFTDDISAATRPAVASVRELGTNVKILGDSFRMANDASGALTVSMRDARAMFDTAGRSLNVMKAALKDAGVSALDTRLIMGQLNRELTAGRKEALGFSSSLSTAKESSRGLVVTLGDVVNVVKELGHLIAKPFEALAEFGNKAQEAFGERINTLRAYNALLGDSKKATEEFQWAQGFAMANPFTSSEVEDVQKRMLASGMNADQARASTAGIMDLATLKGTGPEGKKALQAGSAMFAEVGEQGLSLRTMRALSQDFGISMTRIQVELAKLVGEKTDEASLEKLQKRISKGEWSGETGGRVGQLAVLNMIKNLVGEKNLGEFAMGGAQTVEVAQSNQGEQLKNLLKTFDSEVLPGVKAYKEALAEQGALFNSNTMAGEQMSRMLQDTASASFQMKTVWESFTNGFLESFTATWNEAGKEAGTGEEGVKSLSESMKSMGSIIGGLAGPIRGTLDFMSELSPVVTVLGTALATLVTIVRGTVTSIVAYTTALADSVLHPTKARDNFRVAGEVSAEAWEQGAAHILTAAGVKEARQRLPGGNRPGIGKPEGTVADFGGGKKHKKKGGGGAYGDFVGGDWDISGGGAWAPGAAGAAPWASAVPAAAGSSPAAMVAAVDAYPTQVARAAAAGAVTPSDISGGGAWAPGAAPAAPWASAVPAAAGSSPAAMVAAVDAYPTQVARAAAAGAVTPSAGAPVVVEHVDVHIDGSTMSKAEIGDAVVEALRGLGRHTRNPSPARV